MAMANGFVAVTSGGLTIWARVARGSALAAIPQKILRCFFREASNKKAVSHGSCAWCGPRAKGNRVNLIVPADVAMGGPPFVLPGNLSSIGHSNFDHCAGLAAIITAAANPHYTSLNGVLFNKSKTKFTQNPAGYRWRRAVGPPTSCGSICRIPIYLPVRLAFRRQFNAIASTCSHTTI